MHTGIRHTQPLPSPRELRNQFPISSQQEAFVQKTRTSIHDILSGRSQRQLLIVGPCSIHDVEEAKEFARRLRQLATQIGDQFLVVMRAYLEKPRTTLGWKGLLYDPLLDGSADLKSGLEISRRLLLDLADLKVPVGTEFLDPITPHYLGDLISWGCVGARTAASPIHRQMASSLSIPIGFKNAVDGDCDIAIHGALSANSAHSYIGLTEDGRVAQLHSRGNAYCHVVMRGGENGPNYDAHSLAQVKRRLESHRLLGRLLIDCSHDNSGKDHRRQPMIFRSVIEQILAGGSQIAGLLLESYLLAGNQSPPGTKTPLRYGVSLTDSCLDWKSTEQLLLWAYERLTAAQPLQLVKECYAPLPG